MTNITQWIIIFIFVVIILFIGNGFIPVNIGDKDCHKEIAKTECNDRETHLTIGLFGDMKFQCCSPPNTTSRRWVDNVNDCDRYIFLEEDIKKCNDKYYWFGIKKVD